MVITDQQDLRSPETKFHDEEIARAVARERERHEADIARLRLRVSRLENYPKFVALWCYRTHASDSERLSAIKHHPTTKAGVPDAAASNPLAATG